MKNTHASSEQICSQLLKTIINQGSQKVKENRTIKKSESPYTCQRYVKISSNLIKQTGLKSEGFGRNYQIIDDPRPEKINKDEFMYRSLSKIPADKTKIGKNAKIENRSRRKTFFKPKESLVTTTITDKQQSLMSKFKNALGNTKQSKNKKNVVKLDFSDFQEGDLPKNSIVISEEERYADFMRSQIIKKEEESIQSQQRQEIQQAQKREETERKRKIFAKGISQINTNFTFDITGKPLVFSTNTQKKTIENKFPYCLNYKTSSSAYFIKSMKNYKKPEPQFVATKSKKSSIFYNTTNENISEEGLQELDPMEKSTITMNMSQRKHQRQVVYNNNNQRQNSNLSFFKAEEGTFYKEPETYTTIRGEKDLSRVEHSQRPKSGFYKYTRKIKTQGDEIRDCNQRIGFSKTSKSEFFQKQKKENIQAKYFKRPKTCGNQVGRINHINEGLCKEMLC